MTPSEMTNEEIADELTLKLSVEAHSISEEFYQMIEEAGKRVSNSIPKPTVVVAKHILHYAWGDHEEIAVMINGVPIYSHSVHLNNHFGKVAALTRTALGLEDTP